MKIHEYQAKAILARYGVTTPRSEVAFTKEEALQLRERAGIGYADYFRHFGHRFVLAGRKLR